MKKPIMTKNAIEYTIKQLFKIANPNNNIKYNFSINREERELIISFEENEHRIIIKLANDNEWEYLIHNKLEQLTWIDSAKNTLKIPVLLWADRDQPFIIRNGNDLVLNGDIVSSSFFMLSRWEEKHNNDLDIHGRFKYENSVAFKYKFIHIPIVDEYAMLLRKYLQEIFPNINMGKSQFCIKISHDIDDIRRFKSLKQSIRTFGGDLIKTKNLKLLIKSIGEFKSSYKQPKKDPYFLAIYELARLSKENNMNSAFYFKTADYSNYDSGYVIEDYVKECIWCLQELGFEIGFHPGYYTYKNYDKFIEEKERLDDILGFSSYGGRQHYLRFDVNSTWKFWEQAGLKYDSTVGYAEHEGFRCGTCHPFKPFDIDEDRELDIIEIPLIVMDGTLQTYRKLSPEEGLDSIINLMNRCRDVEGVFTLLWHNTSIGRGWDEWFEKVYKVFLTTYGGESKQIKICS